VTKTARNRYISIGLRATGLRALSQGFIPSAGENTGNCNENALGKRTVVVTMFTAAVSRFISLGVVFMCAHLAEIIRNNSYREFWI
jgi:hypothetical protein